MLGVGRERQGQHDDAAERSGRRSRPQGLAGLVVGGVAAEPHRRMPTAPVSQGHLVADRTHAQHAIRVNAVAPAAPSCHHVRVAGTHSYDLSLHWTGNRGSGTSGYRAYSRDHEVQLPGKPTIAGSADPAFRGDPERWNPEELLVASLSQCYMLWYLHLATTAGAVVTAYTDTPTGTMVEDHDGGGQFTKVVLPPSARRARPSARRPP